MADSEGELFDFDLEEGVQLELKVSFNEFDDELILDDGPVAEDTNGVSGGDISDAAKARSTSVEVQNAAGNSAEDDVEIHGNDKVGTAKTGRHDDSERLPRKYDAPAEQAVSLIEKDSSKGRADVIDRRPQCKRRGSFTMEVDDESDPDESNDLKSREASDSNAVPQGEETGDRAIKKHTRGGKKKKRRRHSPNPKQWHEDHDQHSDLYILFKPLNVTAKDNMHDVANELCDRLQERKHRLIHRVVKCIGCVKSLELLDETKKVQIRGGMKTRDGTRRRTSGGIFLTLLKSDRFTTSEQMKEILAEENELLKNARKAKQAEEKELNIKKIQDLRTKLESERKLPKDEEMKSNE